MKRVLFIALSLILLAPPAAAGGERTDGDGPRLRNWRLGLQAVGTWRNRYDVFGVTGYPAGEVADDGRGAGLFFGRRFGDRFLLDLLLTASAHDVADSEQKMYDFEFLIGGTVLFRQRDTLQPFLRGGFGGGGEVLELGDDAGYLVALGTAAQAGGGLLIRLGSRVSLELETVATFTNFLEVTDDSNDDRWPDDSWQVRTSNWGWRMGTGLVFWF